MSGHIGPNCTILCVYPTFGEECQGYCDCDKDVCNASTGCTNSSTGNSYKRNRQGSQYQDHKYTYHIFIIL